MSAPMCQANTFGTSSIPMALLVICEADPT